MRAVQPVPGRVIWKLFNQCGGKLIEGVHIKGDLFVSHLQQAFEFTAAQVHLEAGFRPDHIDQTFPFRVHNKSQGIAAVPRDQQRPGDANGVPVQMVGLDRDIGQAGQFLNEKFACP